MLASIFDGTAAEIPLIDMFFTEKNVIISSVL